MIHGTVDSEEFDMSGLKSRVLTAVIAIPVLLIVVLLFPQLNHLAFCLMMVIITLLGTIEMRSLLSKDHEKLLFTSYSGAPGVKLSPPVWTGPRWKRTRSYAATICSLLRS